MKNFIKILVFIILPTTLLAQDKITGKLIDSTGVGIEGVNVINLSKKIGVISNKDGFFTIKVNINDTLFINSLAYEDKNLVITNNTLESDILLQLNGKTVTLDEVYLSNVNLSGNISSDINIIPVTTFNNFGFTSFKTTTETYTPTQYQISQARQGIVEPLINLISGKLKKLKKNDAIAKEENWVNFAKNLKGEQFYTSKLGLKNEEILPFLYFLYAQKEDEKFNSDLEKLELMEFMVEEVKVFKKEFRDN